jgi:hypothetical protein
MIMVFKKYIFSTLALMASVYASDFNNSDFNNNDEQKVEVSSSRQLGKKRKVTQEEESFEEQQHSKAKKSKIEKRINPAFSLTLPTKRLYISGQNLRGIGGDVWPTIFSYMTIQDIINVAFSSKGMMSFVYSCIVPPSLDLNNDMYKLGNNQLDQLLISHKIEPLKLYEQVIGDFLDSKIPAYKLKNSKFHQNQKHEIESGKREDLKTYPAVPGNVLRNSIFWQLLLNSFEKTYCQSKETQEGIMIDDMIVPKDRTIFSFKQIILPTVSLSSSLRFYAKAMEHRKNIMSYLDTRVNKTWFLRAKEEYVPSILYWGGLCTTYASHQATALPKSALWFGSSEVYFTAAIINALMSSLGIDCSKRGRTHEAYALQLQKFGLLEFVVEDGEGEKETLPFVAYMKSLALPYEGDKFSLKSNFLSYDKEKVQSMADRFKLANKKWKEELKASRESSDDDGADEEMSDNPETQALYLQLQEIVNSNAPRTITSASTSASQAPIRPQQPYPFSFLGLLNSHDLPIPQFTLNAQQQAPEEEFDDFNPDDMLNFDHFE